MEMDCMGDQGPGGTMSVSQDTFMFFLPAVGTGRRMKLGDSLFPSQEV